MILTIGLSRSYEAFQLPSLTPEGGGFCIKGDGIDSGQARIYPATPFFTSFV